MGNKTALPLMENEVKNSDTEFDTAVDKLKQGLEAKIKQLTDRENSFLTLPFRKKDAAEKIKLISQELKSLEGLHESSKFQRQRIDNIASEEKQTQERQDFQEAGPQKVKPPLLAKVKRILERAGIKDTKSQDKTPPTTPNSPQQNTGKGRS